MPNILVIYVSTFCSKYSQYDLAFAKMTSLSAFEQDFAMNFSL